MKLLTDFVMSYKHCVIGEQSLKFDSYYPKLSIFLGI